MSWLNPSSYWDTLSKKPLKSAVELILLDIFEKKQHKTGWLSPSLFWMELIKKQVKTPVDTLMIDMFRKYNRTKPTYRCRFGNRCMYTTCEYVHPGELGYKTSVYVQLESECRYENQEMACRKKCGDVDGCYCIFKHCMHSYEIISCEQVDCQGHCPQCI